VRWESRSISRTSTCILAAGLPAYAPRITNILVWATGKGLLLICNPSLFMISVVLVVTVTVVEIMKTPSHTHYTYPHSNQQSFFHFSFPPDHAYSRGTRHRDTGACRRAVGGGRLHPEAGRVVGGPSPLRQLRTPGCRWYEQFYRNRLSSVSKESSRRAMSARSSYVVDRPPSVICK